MKHRLISRLFYAVFLALSVNSLAGCSEFMEELNEQLETDDEALEENEDEPEEKIEESEEEYDGLVYDEDAALAAAIEKAHEEYDGTFGVKEDSAFIFEENDSCYLIYIELEGAGFVSVYVVQKGINKVVYSAGAQDSWDGILDDYYMQYVELETVGTGAEESSVSGIYYEVLADICGGSPNIYHDRILNDEETKYYKSMYDDVYVDECSGIYYLTLTDMDNDGVQELIFAYAQGMFTVISDDVTPYGSYYIYTVKEGKALKLFESDKVFFGSNNSGSTCGISSVDGKNYFIITSTGVEGAYALGYDIYYKKGSSADVLEKLYSISAGRGNAEFYITKNGEEKTVSKNEFISEASLYMTYKEDKKVGTVYESLPVFEPHNTIERLLDSHVLDNLRD